ncbi:MAX dimerization protein MGA a isoform X2 [Genypterus blacodes]|uniref:MAX dimerization protein MGA a isoform X2 n=1 Tax=Genypterus blacodes TaxID=154954 RepID=UPI003F766767
MASKKKQKVMVSHEEGATAPLVAPAANHAPACLNVLKPGKAGEGGMEQCTPKTEKLDMVKPKKNLNKAVTKMPVILAAMKHPSSGDPQSDNLSPDGFCKGINVTLDNNNMWNEFFRCRTEMILTKQGSRMFPYCRFRISHLDPCRKYSLIMDIQPADNSQYKWTGETWQVTGKAEHHVKTQRFTHPESPSTGQHWMQNPVSFYKLKLTNNTLDQQGNIVLCPMHRYLPRLYVVQSDKACRDLKLNGSSVATFTFPQTEFMAVTAYQNSQFAQLKVDYNPFAKGLKEDGSSSLALKLKSITGKDPCKDANTTMNEQHPVNKSLKTLLANHKPRSLKPVDQKITTPGDPQETSTQDANHSAHKSLRETYGNCQPPQKLFSELMREAHVSLMRCNLEQLCMSNSTNDRTDQTDEKITAVKSKGQAAAAEDSVSLETQSEISSAKKSSNVTNDKSSKAVVQITSEAPKASVHSDVKDISASAHPELNVKQQKRPAPLPLPALALFLKQHSLKSRKVKSTKPKSPEIQLESLSENANLFSDHTNEGDYPAKELKSGIRLPSQASGCINSNLNPSGVGFSSAVCQDLETGQDAVASAEYDGPKPDACVASPAVAESSEPESSLPNIESMLSKSDQPVCTLVTATTSSTLTTISTSPILSPPLSDALPIQHNSKNSSTLQSDLPTMKSTSLLLVCPPLNFEPLSPACSPDPLPPFPASLAIEFDSSPSSCAKANCQEYQQIENSAASVFTWHTVLPPSDPYLGTSFQAPQPLPLGSIMPPLLPSQASTLNDPQSLSTSPASPPPHPGPSFQENEQSLTFPTDLSPLTLQLPLSPTFSSLDADGLSPTPSIADLVHFISSNDDLGMDFSNTEVTLPAPCSPCTMVAEAAHSPLQVQPISANKSQKCRKKKHQERLVKADSTQKVDDSMYTSKKPNLEEVEEQLFVSFTSKEALRLHIGDTAECPDLNTPLQCSDDVQPQQTTDTTDHESAESLEERITGFQKILLRDVKLMKHRQVIHPVLQEVGLKMSLLDPTLAIDLQYLGVQLPIAPSGVSLVPQARVLDPPQSVPAPFTSRTGKTTDVTQIKGWRDKFVPSEALSTRSSKPEVAANSDVPKKNLSAFCSDMLDEYLENEGKLIDERASSFSQPVTEPITYKLPSKSTSYVRTLDSVLKKQTLSPPTSTLISSFVPPSKRPRATLNDLEISRKGDRKQKAVGSKGRKLGPEVAVACVSVLAVSESNSESKLSPSSIKHVAVPVSDHAVPFSESPNDLSKSKNNNLKMRGQINEPVDHTEQFIHTADIAGFKEKNKVKPKLWSVFATSPCVPLTHLSSFSDDMAPLESDSELSNDAKQSNETTKNSNWPLLTRALMKQKDLEGSVVWGGQPRTRITEERSTVALTSLFTLMGFVCENPTAPIELIHRPAPPCLNEFCRLGCVCSSLTYSSRITHCGQLLCMFGCSCLKQKVVLLRNLDGSDSSPSQQNSNDKMTTRRRRKRMKMAYILKEADSVSQPAERVRILWNRNCPDPDPDPIHIPEPVSPSSTEEICGDDGSCARARGYMSQKLKRTVKHQLKEEHKGGEEMSPKNRKKKEAPLIKSKMKTPTPAPAEPHQLALSDQHETSPEQYAMSKRLVIIAECQWKSDADRNHILKAVCEAMAQDRLRVRDPFWVNSYLINPLNRFVEESGSSRCIHYKVHISQPNLQKTPSKPQDSERVTAQQQDKQREMKPQKQKVLQLEEGLEDWQQELEEEAELLEDWHQQVTEEEKLLEDCHREVTEQEDPLEDNQREVTEHENHLEDCQQEVSKQDVQQQQEEEEEEEEEEKEPLEDWQQEVEEDDFEEERQVEEAGSAGAQEDNERRTEERKQRIERKKMMGMALPFLTGISPAGFLIADRKQPGGTDDLVQVNGKLYPLAKIQLGRMGALHPANRLAAYLTGRVGIIKKPQGPTGASSLSFSKLRFTQTSQPISSAALPLQGPKIPTTAVAPRMAHAVISSPGFAASNSSQTVMVQVPASSRPIQAPHHPPQALVPGMPCQRMVLQPVRSASGIRIFRKPDGKLVQLVPLNQLRPVTTNMVIQRGPASTPLLPITSLQGPVVSISNEVISLTTATTTITTTTPVVHVTSVQHPDITSQTNSMITTNTPTTTQVHPITSIKGPLVAMSNRTTPLRTAPSTITTTTNPVLHATSAHRSNVTISNQTNQKLMETTLTTTTPVLPVRPIHSPVVTISKQTTQLTEVLTPVAATTTLSSMSKLHSFSGSSFLGQKGGQTIDILPNCRDQEPIVTSPKVLSNQSNKSASELGPFTRIQSHLSAPTTFISLKPAVGQGAEPGVKTVTASTVCVDVGEDTLKQISQDAVGLATTAPAQPPNLLSESKVKHVTDRTDLPPPQPCIYQTGPPSPELASDPVDLDIICIDEETGLLTRETMGGASASSTELQLDKMQKSIVGVMDLAESSGSETEDSSDVMDESDNDRENRSRQVHCVLERKRRSELSRLFNTLRKEVRLSKERATKVSTLTKAVHVIQELQITKRDLELRKMRLKKTRTEFINSIAQKTGETEETICRKIQNLSESGQDVLQEQKRRVNADLIEVVDLLDETDEQTDNSSDEEKVYRKKTEDMHMVDIEMAEDRAIRKVESNSVKTLVSSEIGSSPQNTQQVCEKVQVLHSHRGNLEKGPQQRVTFIKTSIDSGKNKLLQQSGKEESKQSPGGAVEASPDPVFGSAVNLPRGDNQKDSSSNLTAPPSSPTVTLPTASSAHHDTPTLDKTPNPQEPQHSQTGSQMSMHLPKPLHARSSISDNPAVTSNRPPRTIPNILSRSKKKLPFFKCTNPVEEPPSIQAVVPAEVLSLVGALLPGHQDVMLSPVMLSQMMPTSGVVSVTLNMPSLSHQQTHLNSVTTPLPAGNFSNIVALSSYSDGPALGLDTGHLQSKDQDQPQILKVAPASGPLSSSSQSHNDEAGTKMDVTNPVENYKGNTESNAQSENLTSLLNEIVFLNQQTYSEAEIRSPTLPRNLSNQSLETLQQEEEPGQTSLKHNDLLLDSPLGTDRSSVGGAEQEEYAQSPWLLELDEDSNENGDGGAEKERVGLNVHIEGEPQSSSSTSTNDQLQRPQCVKIVGVLAPPPLQQMKVGGTKVVESSSSDKAGDDGDGRGKDGGTTWRPMPRLVPLGLKGNPPN